MIEYYPKIIDGSEQHVPLWKRQRTIQALGRQGTGQVGVQQVNDIARLPDHSRVGIGPLFMTNLQDPIEDALVRKHHKDAGALRNQLERLVAAGAQELPVAAGKGPERTESMQEPLTAG